MAYIRQNTPRKNFNKFKEAFLYLLSRIKGDAHIGETVLLKHLYFIDFDYYEKYEKQFIGATYMKNKYGPTPKEFAKWATIMLENGEIEVRERKYHGYTQKSYKAIREPDYSKLDKEEIRLIDNVVKKLHGKDARQISTYSHEDVPWLSAENGDIIEYESVFYRLPPYSVKEYDKSI